MLKTHKIYIEYCYDVMKLVIYFNESWDIKMVAIVRTVMMMIMFGFFYYLKKNVLVVDVAGPHHGDGAGGSQWPKSESHRGVCTCPSLFQRACNKGTTDRLTPGCVVGKIFSRSKLSIACSCASRTFSAFLCTLFQEVKDLSSTVLEGEEIRWVITVPAVWRQPAKQFMREAAYLVG